MSTGGKEGGKRERCKVRNVDVGFVGKLTVTSGVTTCLPFRDVGANIARIGVSASGMLCSSLSGSPFHNQQKRGKSYIYNTTTCVVL